MESTPDPEPDVDAILTRVLERTPTGPADAADPEDANASSRGTREPAPPHVKEAFRRIFEMVRQALGAREEDFALGNARLARDRRGVRLEYRWREGSEEAVRCFCGGKSLSVSRYEDAMGVKHAIRKNIRVERDGTKISASDDRENRQIGEADCQAVLEVLEAACRVVAPGEGEGEDGESP